MIAKHDLLSDLHEDMRLELAQGTQCAKKATASSTGRHKTHWSPAHV